MATLDEVIAALQGAANRVPSFLNTSGNAIADTLGGIFGRPGGPSAFGQVQPSALVDQAQGLIGQGQDFLRQEPGPGARPGVDPLGFGSVGSLLKGGPLGDISEVLQDPLRAPRELFFGQDPAQQPGPPGPASNLAERAAQGAVQGGAIRGQQAIGAPQALAPTRGTGATARAARQLPQLPAPREIQAPDFSTLIGDARARAPQGPQQVGENERRARILSGLTGGGELLRNPAPGRAASVADVLTRAGSGVGQAVAEVERENRLFQQRFEDQQLDQHREVVALEVQQEVSNANVNAANTEQYNRTTEAKWQGAMRQAEFELQQAKPTPDGAGGYFIFNSKTGKFDHHAKQQSLSSYVNTLNTLEGIRANASQLTLSVAAKDLVRRQIPVARQPAAYSAMLALSDPGSVRQAIEFLQEGGHDQEALKVQNLADGTLLGGTAASTHDATSVAWAALEEMIVRGQNGEERFVPLAQNWLQMTNPNLTTRGVSEALGAVR